MCDPFTGMLAGAALAGAGVSSIINKPRGGGAAAPAQPDPAEERAKAEAEAAQRANAQLAMDQRRRREQGSLLAKGGQLQPATFTMGDQGTGASPISSTGRLASRSTTARAASLMSRGAPAGMGGGYGGGGGGGRIGQDVALS